jgi:hypothetical protein
MVLCRSMDGSYEHPELGSKNEEVHVERRAEARKEAGRK